MSFLIDKYYFYYKEDIDALKKEYKVKIYLEQDGVSAHTCKSNINLFNKSFTKNG